MMYFFLVDRIVELQPGKRISAVKQLALDESYLRDHFPGFPVMPGVLVLEAMYQTSAWLLISEDEFRSDFARLRETRNVKFGSFVRPGDALKITAEVTKREAARTTFRAVGKVGDTSVASARLILEQDAELTQAVDDLGDAKPRPEELREIFNHIYKPFPLTHRKTMEVERDASVQGTNLR